VGLLSGGFTLSKSPAEAGWFWFVSHHFGPNANATIGVKPHLRSTTHRKYHELSKLRAASPHYNPPSTSRCDQFASTMSTSELATSYAALILADDGVEITVRPYFCQQPQPIF
jgi:hypothetical protein